MGFVVGEGIDEIRPEWAAAARALREPDENVVAVDEDSAEAYLRRALDDVSEFYAARERARGTR
jgi:hypothetical protein